MGISSASSVSNTSATARQLYIAGAAARSRVRGSAVPARQPLSSSKEWNSTSLASSPITHAAVLYVLLDDALFPARGNVAEVRIGQVMRAHHRTVWPLPLPQACHRRRNQRQLEIISIQVRRYPPLDSGALGDPEQRAAVTAPRPAARKLLNYPVLHWDETRLQVLNEPGRAPTAQSWMWVQCGETPNRPVILFDYTTSRVREVPLLLREDYRDYLMTDDYNAAATQDSTRLADIGLSH